MRRALLPALALVITAACGGGGAEDSKKETDSGGTGMVEKVFADPLGDEQIKDALLSLDDMPSGWSIDDSEDEDDADTETSSDDPACNALMGAFEGDEDEAFGEGDVSFTQSEFGPFLSQAIASQEGDAIEKTMGELRQAFETCTSFTDTESDGTKTTFKVSEMSFPDLGDETLAVKLAGDADGFSFTAPLVVTRVDQNVILLVSISIGQPMPGEDLESIARTAVAKVKSAD